MAIAIQHIKSYFHFFLVVSILHVFMAILPQSPAMAAECITLADAPLETPFSVSSVNVMFVLDDSGSMDWEMLVTSDSENNPDGLFMLGNTEKYYLYDEVKDASNNSLNLYPKQSYGNEYLEGSDRDLWKSPWASHNKMYDDPSIEYTPWYTTGNSLANASPDTPRFHPWNGGAPLTAGADKNAGAPFADKQSGMLADVAYAYYQTDLAPDVENQVPTNFMDNNSAQHMVTYGGPLHGRLLPWIFRTRLTICTMPRSTAGASIIVPPIPKSLKIFSRRWFRLLVQKWDPGLLFPSMEKRSNPAQLRFPIFPRQDMCQMDGVEM